MDKIDKFYDEHMSNKVGLDSLLEMIEKEFQNLNERKVKSGSAERLLLVLPKFSPSEAWGDPTSVAREQIARFFNNIRGKSLNEKLTYMTRLFDEGTKISSPARIISTLVVLESLAACITAFNSSTAGFVFEGFLAALLDGEQVADKVAGTLPIEDILAYTAYGEGKSVPMSLKLLTKKSSSVDGSYTNIVNGLARFNKVAYVVVLKEKEENRSMSFHQFTLTRENLEEYLSLGSKKNKQLMLIVNPETGETMSYDQSMQMLKSTKSWDEKFALLQRTVGYNMKYAPKNLNEGVHREPAGRDLVLNESKGHESGGTQWHFTQKMMTELPNYSFLGALNVTPGSLKKAASQYMKILGEEVILLFEGVKNLSENMNKYFTNEDRSIALVSGDAAAKNARFIEKKTLENVSQERAAGDN